MTAMVRTGDCVRIVKSSIISGRPMKAAVRMLVCTIAILMALLWGFSRASAQNRVPRVRRNGRATMTDAGGRVHLRPKPRISEAQRKAAAKRREVFRARAAQSRQRGIR